MNQTRFAIIFESKALIAIDKPAGVLSVPSRFSKEDERLTAASLIKHLEKKSLYPIHRLDQEVSGLLLFAKNAQAQRDLTAVFENRKVKKTYIALSEEKIIAPLNKVELNKIVFNKTVTWENLLVKGKTRVFEAPYGKNAITHAEPEKIFSWCEENFILWKLFPETGRPHQLRFHMAKFGYPIIGDKRYGSSRNFMSHSIALRAIALEFLDENIVNRLDIPQVIRVTLAEDYWQREE